MCATSCEQRDRRGTDRPRALAWFARVDAARGEARPSDTPGYWEIETRDRDSNNWASYYVAEDEPFRASTRAEAFKERGHIMVLHQPDRARIVRIEGSVRTFESTPQESSR